MNKLIALLFIGLILCLLHEMIYFFWPETGKVELSLFMDKSYNEKITVSWYMYELGNIMDRIIWAFVLCKGAGEDKKKLSQVAIVFIGFYITQFGFYLWNRNTSYFANVINYLYMACVFIFVLIPEKKTGKYVQM